MIDKGRCLPLNREQGGNGPGLPAVTRPIGTRPDGAEALRQVAEGVPSPGLWPFVCNNSMLKLPRTAYDWALRHLITEGDTDLFPTPFEIAAIKHLWKTLGPQFANTDLSSYVWRGGRRFVVPKSILSFRVATQLDPLDSLVFAALIHKYGPKLEASRIPVAENRVFSFRLAPSADGRLYSDSPTWHDFWKTSLVKAESHGYVVVADIADFYNQIYHHDLERQFEVAELPQEVAKAIKQFLQALTEKESRGVPVGPHSSHILGECALNATDRTLLSHGYDFCRYVDDIHIFVKDQESAMGALYDLARILDNQQRLMLQNKKTRIMPAMEFAGLAQSMLIDRPASDRESEILALISRETGGDPYREVSLADLDEEEMALLSRPVLEDVIEHYLRSEEVDYPRLGWLLRRLTQVGAPGALDYVLSHLQELSPILGPVTRYVMSAVPHVSDEKETLGAKIVQALAMPIIKKSPYLQMVLLDVLASIPELNHADAVTSRYAESDPLIRREILRVAGSNGRRDWLRDRKSEFRSMDEWMRRAFISAAPALPSEEAKFWLQSVKDTMSPIEKVVAHHAFRGRTKKELKLGEIQIVRI